jgi:hypothetical protein
MGAAVKCFVLFFSFSFLSFSFPFTHPPHNLKPLLLLPSLNHPKPKPFAPSRTVRTTPTPSHPPKPPVPVPVHTRLVPVSPEPGHPPRTHIPGGKTWSPSHSHLRLGYRLGYPVPLRPAFPETGHTSPGTRVRVRVPRKHI